MSEIVMIRISSFIPRLVWVTNAEGYPEETGVMVRLGIEDAGGLTGGDIILTYDPI